LMYAFSSHSSNILEKFKTTGHQGTWIKKLVRQHWPSGCSWLSKDHCQVRTFGKDLRVLEFFY
jgi:hypothetical protein